MIRDKARQGGAIGGADALEPKKTPITQAIYIISYTMRIVLHIMHDLFYFILHCGHFFLTVYHCYTPLYNCCAPCASAIDVHSATYTIYHVTVEYTMQWHAQ